jgi:hypothetical protein
MTVNVANTESACGSLGQPSPIWSAANRTVNQGPATLSWASIPGSARYDLRTCTAAYTGGKCEPNLTPVINNSTSLNYTPTAPSNGSMTCIGVTAVSTTAGTSSSPMSPVKCIRRDANDLYHY